jgi:hypothetical protein
MAIGLDMSLLTCPTKKQTSKQKHALAQAWEYGQEAVWHAAPYTRRGFLVEFVWVISAAAISNKSAMKGPSSGAQNIFVLHMLYYKETNTHEIFMAHWVTRRLVLLSVLLPRVVLGQVVPGERMVTGATSRNWAR